MNKFVSGAIGVEIELTGNSNTYNFPDIPILRGKRIKHIEICDIPKSPSGKVRYASDACFITLIENNTQQEMIQNLNVLQLNARGNRLFINKIIDLQRSYVSLPGVALDELAGKCLYFVFWFDEPTNRSIVPVTLNRTSYNFFEVKLTGLTTYFEQNLKLKNKKIQNILLSYPEITPSGNDGLVDYTAIHNKFITLSRNNVEFFKQIPIIIFYQSTDNYRLRLQNIQFDFQNSYIETLTTTEDDLKSVFFNVLIDEN